MNIRVPGSITATLLVTACANAPQSDIYASADEAMLEYKGGTYDRGAAVPGSGARYVGDGLEWVTKGSGAGAEGILSRHLPDGASGELVETCSGI